MPPRNFAALELRNHSLGINIQGINIHRLVFLIVHVPTVFYLHAYVSMRAWPVEVSVRASKHLVVYWMHSCVRTGAQGSYFEKSLPRQAPQYQQCHERRAREIPPSTGRRDFVHHPQPSHLVPLCCCHRFHHLHSRAAPHAIRSRATPPERDPQTPCKYEPGTMRSDSLVSFAIGYSRQTFRGRWLPHMPRKQHLSYHCAPAFCRSN